MPQPTSRDLATLSRHDHMFAIVEGTYMRAIVREKNRYITAVSKAYELTASIPEDLTQKHKDNMFILGKRYNSRSIKMFSGESQDNILKKKF